jgi:excisionase family DNA binding protein
MGVGMVASTMCALVQMDVEPRLFRRKEAAKYLRLSPWLILQMAHRGELKFIQRVEYGPLLFDKNDLDQWIEKAKQ